LTEMKRAQFQTVFPW